MIAQLNNQYDTNINYIQASLRERWSSCWHIVIQSGGFRIRVDLRDPRHSDSTEGSTGGLEGDSLGSALGVDLLLGSVGMSAAFSLGLFCGSGRSSTSGGLTSGCSSDRISCLRFRANVLSPTLTP